MIGSQVQARVNKLIIRHDHGLNEEVRYWILISRYPYHYIRSFRLLVVLIRHVLATLLATAEPAGDTVLGLLSTLREIVSECAMQKVMTPKTYLSDVLVKRVHRLVQLSASLLDRLVDGLVCFLPVCLELLVDLVCAIASLSREPVNLLAGVGGEDLGIFADLCAFAGDVLLANVLDLGCVGCGWSVSVMSS
jgi:hypothetical protein